MNLTMNLWTLRFYVKRAARGLRYAVGMTTEGDAWTLFHDANIVTGYRPLEGISETSVLEWVAERFGETTAELPQMRRLVTYACARVADKWCSTGDITSAAEDWAMSLITENAEDFGLPPLADAQALDYAEG